MNVLLTRARLSLWVLCHAATLSTSKVRVRPAHETPAATLLLLLLLLMQALIKQSCYTG